MRACCCGDGKNFAPASNARNQGMLKEAANFAIILRKAEKAITDYKLAGDAILANAKATMSAPLPHLFEETAAGAGGNVKSVESVGGAAFDPDTITSLAHSSSAQTEAQVLVPIKRWLSILADLQHRNKEVEAMRLEVDSWRHSVTSQTATVDKLRDQLSKASGGKSGKIESNLDQNITKLQHYESKLKLAIQSFQEKEQALQADLTTLIKDAAWLRHYYAFALKTQAEAMTGAVTAMGDTKLPNNVDVADTFPHGSTTGGTVGAPSSMQAADTQATDTPVPKS